MLDRHAMQETCSDRGARAGGAGVRQRDVAGTSATFAPSH